MAALPYMPLYVADYLADAAHLSTLGHGAYLLLIMTYWQRGSALPADDRKLARIARVSPEEWDDIRDDIEEFFTEIDGQWTHKRIDAELGSVKAKTEQARAAGKASAERRSNSKSTTVQRPFNERSTTAQRQSNHTDTDTYINPPTPLPGEFDEFWKAYPHKIGKGAAEKAFPKARKEAEQTKIMAGLQAYIESKPPDRPWCNPATWLNQSRWEDQPANVQQLPASQRRDCGVG
jgi:uncharacterized protein YdaU (DUF1376 family)